MCGIIGVLADDVSREDVTLAEVVAALEAGHMSFDVSSPSLAAAIDASADHIERADTLLRGVTGVTLLSSDPSGIGQVDDLLRPLEDGATRCEEALDGGAIDPGRLEEVNRSLVRLRDALWAVRHDRLRTALAAMDLAGRDASPSAVAAFAKVQIALSAIDRLEVRGRDSAGVLVSVRHHGLDLGSAAIAELVAERSADPLFKSGSVRACDDVLCFVYKAAAEIGELGDNTQAMRDAIRSDPLLHRAVTAERARATILGHTRWASVGLISEANAHPLASDAAPFVAGVLNGDIDNHADLRVGEGIETPPDITTDAKIIPMLTSRGLADGTDPVEAFRRTVASFEGSVAIGAVTTASPSTLMFALRGSGQALYVGFADGAFVVASEPYGIVEQATSYLRLDGEALADPDDPASRGQIVVCSSDGAGTLSGVRRLSYSGTELPVDPSELTTPQITTRDIDRGSFPHFLLKEIHESPRSVSKTMRGRLVGGRVSLGPDVVPDDVVERLAAGSLRRVLVTGQGTAAIAAMATGRMLAQALQGSPVTVDAGSASELSGFGLREDMSDTLLIAVSQSGTSTDTNRTVEVVRGRGAPVISIVNRRQSDLTDRSDGVLYTSDGRDVEMAVPSTKAFYAQVAAGYLLSAVIAEHVPGASGVPADVLDALARLPDAMREVLASQDEIAEIARRHAPGHRYWSVIGNGANLVAAAELRIKLSELCYKSVALDVTEEKKHIDLSAEPLMIVCAAGLTGSNAEDVSKEIEYFRAHRSAPVVIAGEGEGAYEAALDVIRVPSIHPDVAFVLSTVAGHLFGYEAALAIDESGRPLKQARAAIEQATDELSGANAEVVFERLSTELRPAAGTFFDGLRSGVYGGSMDPATAVRVASLFRYATGVIPLDAFQVEHGKVGTPSEVLTDLTDALTAAIDELTRTVDTIKHQAKTVTVGISRSDETLLRVGLVREVLEAGAPRDGLSYATLKTVAALDPAVADVLGYTHYGIEGDVNNGATVHVTDRGGVARDIPSRTDKEPMLRGTKHRVAAERQVLVTTGRGDGRKLILVPETKGSEVVGLVLLHVRFHERLDAEAMRGVLSGYRDRYAALRDLVTETEPTFREEFLAEIDVEELLVASIQALADRWRSSAT